LYHFCVIFLGLRMKINYLNRLVCYILCREQLAMSVVCYTLSVSSVSYLLVLFIFYMDWWKKSLQTLPSSHSLPFSLPCQLSPCFLMSSILNRTILYWDSPLNFDSNVILVSVFYPLLTCQTIVIPPSPRNSLMKFWTPVSPLEISYLILPLPASPQV
jgi:hypothetical protein